MQIRETKTHQIRFLECEIRIASPSEKISEPFPAVCFLSSFPSIYKIGRSSLSEWR